MSKALGESMNSELDEYDYQKWYLENFSYRGDVLVLDMARLQIKGDQNISPRYLVVFDDVKHFQIYDEAMHTEQEMNSRTGGVIGVHENSALMQYLGDQTRVLEITPGKCMHYSVLTADEFIHVVTRREPKVIKIT